MIINNKRALAYTARIDSVTPINGADSIELVKIRGWEVIAKIGEFKPGDLCVYFEIDSKLPERNWAEFMRPRNFKVKTMKLNKLGVVSQGLALPVKVFTESIPKEENKDLTDILGVTYIEAEDNERKADSARLQELSAMSRHPKVFKNKFVKKLMRYKLARNIILKLCSGKAKVSAFPKFVSKTDEERIENLPELLGSDTVYIVTEKLDGTSCTYALERVGKRKFKYYVASRNQCVEPTATGERSIYWDLERKYNIKDKLTKYLQANPDLQWACIQGEGVGRVCGNPLKLKENDLYVFNFITEKEGKIPMVSAKHVVEDMWGIKWVPFIGAMTLPETMEQTKQLASGASKVNPEVLREGLVFRTFDNKTSFKNVSKEYLLSKKGK